MIQMTKMDQITEEVTYEQPVEKKYEPKYKPPKKLAPPQSQVLAHV